MRKTFWVLEGLEDWRFVYHHHIYYPALYMNVHCVTYHFHACRHVDLIHDGLYIRRRDHDQNGLDLHDHDLMNGISMAMSLECPIYVYVGRQSRVTL